jgi:hypothetical protein
MEKKKATLTKNLNIKSFKKRMEKKSMNKFSTFSFHIKKLLLFNILWEKFIMYAIYFTVLSAKNFVVTWRDNKALYNWRILFVHLNLEELFKF